MCRSIIKLQNVILCILVPKLLKNIVSFIPSFGEGLLQGWIKFTRYDRQENIKLKGRLS